MPGDILPNLTRSVERHLTGYSDQLSKPQYGHFRDAIAGIIEGADSLAGLARKSGTAERTLWHFFNESVFDDQALLTRSAKVMNHHTETRSTQQSFLILDFTSVFKTGKNFEWSDWLWDEETDQTNTLGHEQVIALEYDPEKDYRKCLGMRRYYHAEKLYQTEYAHDDFEKKPVTVSRLVKAVYEHTNAPEVLVDGEFINGFLVNRFETCHFAWTGRIKKIHFGNVHHSGERSNTGAVGFGRKTDHEGRDRLADCSLPEPENQSMCHNGHDTIASKQDGTNCCV